jgi:signal transduction histidine kinase
LESLAARATVPVRLTVDLVERPPEAVEIAAYYVASEALANIGKHSAASAAEVRVERAGALLMVDVEDDGLGGAGLHAGSGLRAWPTGSRRSGETRGGAAACGGTRVHAEIPCR